MVAIMFNNGCKITHPMQWLRRAWRFAIQIATEHASRQHLSLNSSRCGRGAAHRLASSSEREPFWRLFQYVALIERNACFQEGARAPEHI